MTALSHNIPNMIQGVTQQAAQQRRDTQCEAQFDCFNSTVDGCVARAHGDLKKFLAGKDFTNAFFYEVRREAAESYILVVSDGELLAYDLADGTACTVSVALGIMPVLLDTAGHPKDVLRAATLDDSTFIASSETLPSVLPSPSLSPARPPEALVHFRAGNYSTKYQLSVKWGGLNFTWSYTTPDNSTSANGPYITTNQLAATFYRALTGTAASVVVSGTPAVDGVDTGPASAGDASYGVVEGIAAITMLGFSVAINGNVLRIWRPSDSLDFEINCSDGAADTYMKAVKDSVPQFSDLPYRGFDGFVVKIKGDNKAEEDDYYVKYDATENAWVECVKANTPFDINPLAMPVEVRNTAYRTFAIRDISPNPWGGRVVGDLESSPDPYFIGRSIKDISFDNRRMLILTQGYADWSKTRNPYVFFPDTVQTVLDTAPIHETISADRKIALLERVIQHDENTYLWGREQQFRVSSGTDPFRVKSLDVKKSTAYTFAPACIPLSLGRSLYFGSENGAWATIRDLTIIEGKPRGDTEVSAHVPKYIKSGIRWLTGSDTAYALFLTSDGAGDVIYVYNFFIQDNNRLQSAWNIWRMPAGSTVLWASVYNLVLKVLVQRSDGVALLHFDLKRGAVDDEATASTQYATRLDFRLTEAGVTKTLNGVGNTEITLPYTLGTTSTDLFKVVAREDAGGFTRGQEFTVLALSGTKVTVEGDITSAHFYCGYRISAERQESTFYLRSQDGNQPLERLQVQEQLVVFSDSGYFRAEVVTKAEGKKFAYEIDKKLQPYSTNFRFPVRSVNEEVTVTLINDSFLPSAWQSEQVWYTPVARAVPEGAKTRTQG